jgi:hypothetical protein
VTFSTDMFHPLITPLTTYLYTTDIQDNGTVSATDEERLPPGGFSLRHGFPSWFGRGRRTAGSSSQATNQYSSDQTPPRQSQGSLSVTTTPESRPSPPGAQPSYMRTRKPDVSTYQVLHYIRSTFDNEEILDSIPLEAAGNPGAWHAWRTHQIQQGKQLQTVTDNSWHDGLDAADSKSQDNPAAGNSPGRSRTTAALPRQPGEWDWQGVWEDRVKKGIAASLSEPVLYGTAGGADEVVRYINSSILSGLEFANNGFRSAF